MSILQFTSLPKAKSNEVVVYVAFLEGRDPEPYYAVLSPQEQKRAGDFKFDIHRRRYILSQGILRALLEHYTGQAPEAVQFTHGIHGKPALADNPSHLEFNISHTEEVAIFGFTYDYGLGVDVESKKRHADILGIAQRYFTPHESSQISALEGDEQREAFFNGWTRKEAFLKATGEGLYFPLNECEMTLLPGEPPRIVHIQEDTQKAQNWKLFSFPLDPHYIVAVAYEGALRELKTILL